MCLFKTASRSISYLIAAKALLRLLVFNFTVERLFADGALSIQFFKQGPAYKKEGPDPNKGSNQQKVKI